MPQIDPYTSIENFRELKRLELETAKARAEAVNQKNYEIVEAGKSLVAGGMDQWELKAKVWETVDRHITLLKRAGINTYGRYELQRGQRKGDLEVKSHPVRMQTGLCAVIALEATVGLRGDTFHDVADVDGIDSAMKQFAAPDLCYVYVHNGKTGEYVAENCLDPGGFSSYDTEFSDEWSGSSNPFGYLRDFECEAERGDSEPSLDERPLTPKQLIYGAGLFAVHSAWLDEIEASI